MVLSLQLQILQFVIVMENSVQPFFLMIRQSLLKIPKSETLMIFIQISLNMMVVEYMPSVALALFTTLLL